MFGGDDQPQFPHNRISEARRSPSAIDAISTGPTTVMGKNLASPYHAPGLGAAPCLAHRTGWRPGLGSAREAEVRDAKQWGARIFTSRHIHHSGLNDVLKPFPKIPVPDHPDCDALDTSKCQPLPIPRRRLDLHAVIDLIAGVAAKAPIAGFNHGGICAQKDRYCAFAYTAAELPKVIGHIARQI